MNKFKRALSKFLLVIPDKLYLRIAFRIKVREKMDFKNPITFNQKLQWLKVYNRKSIYSSLVDKYEVKKYVSRIVGEDIVIKTIGIYDKFEDIDFSTLPNQFVIKCTHDSGSVIICRNKSAFSVSDCKKRIVFAQKHNLYSYNRECVYKNVRPRILIEEYMEDNNQKSLTDYKFFCFNGEPRFLYVSTGLENHATATISFLNLDWSFSKYEREDFEQYKTLPARPQCYSQMIEIAKTLSTGMPFVRVDLYEINGHVYFSELTFFPWSGFRRFKNKDHDVEIGKMLILPRKEEKQKGQ